MASVNGTGKKMPLVVIVKGQTHKSVLSYNTADGPVEANWTFQINAWREDVLGVEWFENIFLENCKEHRQQLTYTTPMRCYAL